MTAGPTTRLRHARTIAAIVLALAAAAPARAQARRLEASAGGGATIPVGSASGQFDTGGYFTLGAGWRLDEALTLRLDYGHSDSRLEGDALSAGTVEGSHVVHSLELDLRWTVDPGGPAPIYLIGGPGLYRSQAEITHLGDYEPGPGICNPWLQVCVAPPVPAEQILGSRSSTDLGVNLGAGVELPIHGALRFFVEVRWRYVRGGEYGLPGTQPKRATVSSFPITLGLRF